MSDAERKLSRRQLQVAQALYEGQGDDEVCVRFKMAAHTLEHWLADGVFQAELDRLCGRSMRQTRFILTRYGPIAAMQLAGLLGEKDKPDTVRRAVLDLIDRCLEVRQRREADGEEAADLSDEQARQMLLELAQGYQETEKGT